MTHTIRAKVYRIAFSPKCNFRKESKQNQKSCQSVFGRFELNKQNEMKINKTHTYSHTHRARETKKKEKHAEWAKRHINRDIYLALDAIAFSSLNDNDKLLFGSVIASLLFNHLIECQSREWTNRSTTMARWMGNSKTKKQVEGDVHNALPPSIIFI